MKRFLAILVVVAVCAVAILVAVGAIHFSTNEHSATITIDKQQIEEAGNDALRETGEALEGAGERLQDESQEKDADNDE